MPQKEMSVLVVDDSATTRRVVSDLLKKNGIKVAGEAKNGVEAIEMIEKISPDVVILDIWMPLKSGLEVLQDLYNQRNTEGKKLKKDARAVVLSCLIESDKELALRCLRLGAVTCVAKPQEGILHIEKFSEELVRAVREAFMARPQNSPRFQKIDQKKPLFGQDKASLSGKTSKLIAIGSSTGGPQILEELIAKLPGSFKNTMVVVQHMPAGFTKSFSERLDRLSEVRICEAKEGEKIAPQTVYVAPGGRNIAIRENSLYFDDSKDFRIKPSIDCFFMSAAKEFKEKFLGIILSGMSGDAKLGARAVKENGGWLIVQEPSTCMIDGMVNDIIKMGLADEVLPPERILEKIIETGNN